MCRSRRELSNEYVLAKIGVDTADNEPLEVWGENSIQYSLHSLLAARRLARLCFARIRWTRKIVTHGVILHTFEVTFFVSRFDDLVPYQHRKVILWSQLPLPSASHRLLVHPFLCCVGV